MKVMFLVFCFLSVGCAQKFDGTLDKVEGKSWDFDHQVQFEQYKINDNLYNITVRSTSRTNFLTLSAFLVRQSFRLCKTYGFKIEIIDGVETYNDEKYIKSYIPSSLEANIECPIS